MFEKVMPVDNGNNGPDLFDECIHGPNPVIVAEPKRRDVEVIEGAKRVQAGIRRASFFFSDGLDPHEVGIGEFTEWTGTISEELRMFAKQAPGCRTVTSSTAEKVISRGSGVL